MLMLLLLLMLLLMLLLIVIANDNALRMLQATQLRCKQTSGAPPTLCPPASSARHVPFARVHVT